MSDKEDVNLACCTEYHNALGARVPRIAHATVLVLTALLGSAFLWAGLTQADLVVRAEGRVRPAGSMEKVFAPARAEAISASVGGRIVEVRFRQGDEVRRGDVLVRLDSERVENEITRQKRTIQAGEEELTQLRRLQALCKQQFEAARARALAELEQAKEEVRQSKARQAQDVRLAQVELASARDEHQRVRRLTLNSAASAEELGKVRARVSEAEAKLEKARLPVEEARLEVLRRGLVVLEKDDAVKREELALKRGARQADVDAARSQLVSLELEHRQALLRSPSDGIVTSPEVKVGDVLEPGKVVVEIAQQKGFRFEVQVPSEEVGRLRVGMAVRVKLDAFDHQHYGTVEGTVSFISPDSGVPDGQRSAVYLVRIDLAADEVGRDGLRGQVKLGMAGQAEIISGQESVLALLAKKIRQSVSLP